MGKGEKITKIKRKLGKMTTNEKTKKHENHTVGFGGLPMILVASFEFFCDFDDLGVGFGGDSGELGLI